MKLLVLSRDQIITHFGCLKKHIIISICGPSGKFVDLPIEDERVGLLYMKFVDLDRPCEGSKWNDFLFDSRDARDILSFVALHKDDVELIVCQCEAGISRSAGVAAALSKIYNGTDEYFFKHYLPNTLVYSTILKEYHK